MVDDAAAEASSHIEEAGSGTTMTKLVEIISERLEWPMDGDAPGPQTSLGEGGLGLDSLMVVEFALDIEEEFDLEIDEDQMLDMGTMTLVQVAEMIEGHKPETGA